MCTCRDSAHAPLQIETKYNIVTAGFEYGSARNADVKFYAYRHNIDGRVCLEGGCAPMPQIGALRKLTNRFRECPRKAEPGACLCSENPSGARVERTHRRDHDQVRKLSHGGSPRSLEVDPRRRTNNVLNLLAVACGGDAKTGGETERYQ